jgi:hypothetical protein
MPVKLFSRPSSSFSLVEILVAVAFISLILTALSVNMVYTQRSIKNSQMRAKAIDQASACLDKFRNLRDSNIWRDFCARLDPNLNQCQQELGTGVKEYRCNFNYAPSLDETGRCINCFTSASVCNGLDPVEKRDGFTINDSRVNHLGPTCYEENYLVCEEFITNTNNFHYEGKYYISFQRGQLDPNANTVYPTYLGPVNTGCYKTTDSKEFARVSITIEYQDFSNVTQHVTVYQDFAKSDYEAPY